MTYSAQPAPAPPPVEHGGASGLFQPPGVIFQSVSGGLIKARLIVVGIVIILPLVVLLVLTFLLTYWLLLPVVPLALILVWLLWLIPRQVRALGYAERDDDMLIRKGILFRQMTAVPYGRMQYVDVAVGPLDRACGIAKVQLFTASAATDAAIPGLPPQEAARLRDRLSERGEARMAGL